MAKPNKTKSNIPARKFPKWFYIILFIIPFLFFVLLELGLRIFDYGKDFPVFVQASDLSDKLYLNPELSRKYFSQLKQGPGVVPVYFDRTKKQNTFRVFVLGESSVAGWPYIYNASFPALLKKRLQLLYPNNVVEVINCGMSAINTYTIRDITPDIIAQNPDLVLIYTGHNEYYGAYGVGSTISLGQSRNLINTYLWALKFRTVQLTANLISGIASLFSSSSGKPIKNSEPETLMAAMIEESLIPLNSDLFTLGVEQFEGNMRDILKMFKQKNIPVIIGTLTSNLKDQKPFVSVKADTLPPANKIYEEAQQLYNAGSFNDSRQFFLYAKDLDALRFRAPAEMNRIIRNLSKEFNCTIIDIDSIFNGVSPDGLAGNNLFVDHLHPNVKGHRLVADFFISEMERLQLTPKGKRNELPKEMQDSILIAEFPLTPLDSVIAYLRTIQLTGAYPFVPKGQPNNLIAGYNPQNIIDSTALKVLRNNITWGDAHILMAEHFYRQGEYKSFLKEMDAIIEARPFYLKSYEETINLLLKVNLLTEAVPYLKKLHLLQPSFFTTKWLGEAAIINKDYKQAKDFLEQSLAYSDNDYRVWYNLAGIYYYNNEIDKSLSAVEKSLSINPEYTFARNIYIKLKQLKSKQIN